MLSEIAPQHLVLGVLVAVAITVGVSVHFSVHARAERFVRGRPRLSSAEFAALFRTEEEAALAPVIRDRLREYIPVDPALVRPDDKLCDELQLAVIDGLDANAFVKEIETVIGTRIPDQEAQRMFTLRDIVSYVAARSERAT
jgi:acyl carrier protein